MRHSFILRQILFGSFATELVLFCVALLVAQLTAQAQPATSPQGAVSSGAPAVPGMLPAPQAPNGVSPFAPSSFGAVTAQRAATQELTPAMARTEKREIVARNLQLTAQEAQRFWPVYEAYQRHLQEWNARMARLIEEYVHQYDGLSNEQAQRLVEEFVALNEHWARLQRSYLPKFEQVVPATKVARYYHIEHKLHALAQYELATVIPLMK